MQRVIFLIFFAIILQAGVSRAEQIIYLDPEIDCGLQPNGKVVNLLAGENRFQWVSGAYTYWSFEYAWLTYVHVYIHVLDEIQNIGSPEYFDYYQQASDNVAGQIFTIFSPVDSPATLYVFDDPCGDNKGDMTIKLLDSPVEANLFQWGEIKALYR